MTGLVAAVGSYPCHHFIDHGRFWSISWDLVQLMKGEIGLAQLALMGLEMDLGSMDCEREHPKQNLHIQGNT